METERVATHVNDPTDRRPRVPPGFSSLTTFNIKIVQDDVMASANASCTAQCIIPDEKPRKSFRYRPWVNYRESDNSSGEESESEFFEQDVPSVPCLPKGVLRGCSECKTCQKVTVRWRPHDACRPTLDEAPVFYPSEEEFKDTLEYIASIRPSAEQYGICRIVPPPSWRPPCLLKEKNVWENSKFTTSIQQVDKLQNSDFSKKINRNHSFMRTKRQKLLNVGNNSDENMAEVTQPRYHNSSVRFGFEPGPDFTLESFQKYADDFKEQYFHIDADFDVTCGQQEPSVENIEGEYWRIIERPTEEIEVLYGADLDTGVFGSGFPEASASSQNSELADQHMNSGWNLNYLARLPGSLLSFESGEIPGVLVPWLYIGMCFSSFCWHVEDHHLYSLNYLHWGSPKIWYGVPGKDASKLEEAMKKHLPELFQEQPDLLHNLVTQFSPSLLRLEGVPVYRCIQNAGEFILSFPRAYHSGFNCGFNCAEAVNVAPLDWLPHGQNAVELYSELGRKISLSHDKLLLGAAREAVRAQWNSLFLRKNTSDKARWNNFCGSDGILAKALKARIDMEHLRREYLCSSQSRKMDAAFDANSERECVLCHYDLHLSAASCPCSSDRFACLIHAKNLCSCSWDTRIFLFRYNINELNVLLDAVRGKLSAVHRWGIFDLGLSLSSYLSKEKVLTDKKVREQQDTEPNTKEPCLRLDNFFQSLGGHNSSSMTSPSYSDQEGAKNATSSQSNSNSTDVVEENARKDVSSLPGQQSVELLPEKATECVRSAARVTVGESSADILPAKEISDCGSAATYLSQHSGSRKTKGKSKEGDTELNFDTGNSDTAIPSCTQRSLDRHNHQQKGPEMAKEVQRINCNVEVLSYGVVFSGKLWSTSQAIFPKGYKSRVKYLSILDPTGMCYYVSEILDAGLLGPLFIVTLEQCPSEVFVHVSATKCWDMVRERLNREIKRQHNMGRFNLPSLQPPRSVDGLKMFGLSSPAVTQAIKALDYDHVCTEYWRSRHRELVPRDPAIVAMDHGPSVNNKKCINEHSQPQPAASKLTVRGLFKKANPEELDALHSLLSNDAINGSGQVLIQLLNEEIESRLY